MVTVTHFAYFSRIHFFKKSWIFQASVRNCLNCLHNCEDHSLLDFISAVQYMKYFIYNFTLIPHGLIRTHTWPVTKVSGFIAQLVRASHRNSEVTGSNPVEILNFSGFYTQLLSTSLQEINPTNTVFYSPELRAEVFCLQLSFKYRNWLVRSVMLVGSQLCKNGTRIQWKLNNSNK